MSRYWKNIAQEEWKPYSVNRKKKTPEALEQEKCRSPFHFLERYRNLSQQRLTPCRCSREVTDRSTFKVQDIRLLFQKQVQSQNIFYLNHLDKNSSFSSNSLYVTREDNVRGEHDRRKQASGPLNNL